MSSWAQDTLVIAGVGDVMLGTNYPEERYLPPGNANMLLKAAEDLQRPDITFANLEGTILTTGGQAKQCNDPSKCYVFRMPESYGQFLADCGIDMVSLANNHSGDMGSTGRKVTQDLLESLNIGSAGHLNQRYTLIEKDSIVYGMCAFSPNKGTHRINNYENARSIVRELDTICDVIIASFHGGAEGPDHCHVTRD
ncbi:MAG: CapA family protein, partial [Flavobacteriales bacterium]|nr:CapA family protein [Flavobacteriales bacterium]